MLRSPAQAALSDLSRLARDLAASYEHALELARSEESRRLFASRIEEQKRFADRAGEELARLGDHPNEPDPERRELARAVRRARAALVGDEDRRLARELEGKEAELEEQLDEALGTRELPPSAEAWLRGERRRFEAMRALLRDVMAAD